MKTTTKEFLGIAAILGLLALASNMSHSDEQRAYEEYCENVAMWESSTLPEIERPGHPDYGNRECK